MSVGGGEVDAKAEDTKRRTGDVFILDCFYIMTLFLLTHVIIFHHLTITF